MVDTDLRTGPTTSLRLTARGRGQDAYTGIEHHGLTAAVRVERTAEGPHRVDLTIVAGEAGFVGIVHAEVRADAGGRDARYFMPAFMVGRNGGDAPVAMPPRMIPRLRRGAEHGAPFSDHWSVRADRLSHPVSAVVTGGRLVAVSGTPYLARADGGLVPWVPGAPRDLAQFCGFSCSLEPVAVGYTIGYDNAPWLVLDSTRLDVRTPVEEGAVRIGAGESLHVSLLVWDEAADDARAVSRVLRAVYARFHEPPRAVGSPEAAARAISAAIRDSAFRDETGTYACVVFENADGSHTYRDLPSISWTNGASIAAPLLVAAARFDDETMRAQALRFFDGLVHHQMNPAAGLPFCATDDEGRPTNVGWWWDAQGMAGHSGYLVGQAVYMLLEAYRAERDLRGVEHADWLAFANSVLEVVHAARNGDGEYAYVLSERTGAGLEYDSLASSWGLAALALLAEITGDRTRVGELVRSARHYHEAFVVPMEGYGGALDVAKAADSEGIIALVKAIRWLHELTGDDTLLDDLRDGLDYEFSFKFAWNPPIQVPPLSHLGWSACGGSVTSIANPHVHPMGSVLVDDMLYYLDARPGDAYVASRLADTVAWGCQSYNTRDREFDFGRVGWMSERFCHSQGLVEPWYPDGRLSSVWFALQAWGGASVVHGMVGDLWTRRVADAGGRGGGAATDRQRRGELDVA